MTPMLRSWWWAPARCREAVGDRVCERVGGDRIGEDVVGLAVGDRIGEDVVGLAVGDGVVGGGGVGRTQSAVETPAGN